MSEATPQLVISREGEDDIAKTTGNNNDDNNHNDGSSNRQPQPQQNNNDEPAAVPPQNPCKICSKFEIEYRPSTCQHAAFCKRCAMKVATGGKCRVCQQMFPDVKHI